ncbi:MAG: WG repeat-containing protein [Leptolyngbya sp.]|nr:WG repeat-containing protein [Candidatus Melainabacteria bacterium]
MSRTAYLNLTILLVSAVFFFGTSVSAFQKIGIVDSVGKAIIPCEYHRIEKLSNGFFFLEKMDKSHPMKYSYDGTIVDQDGKPISIKLPANCTLSNVYLPRSTNSNENTGKLPSGTIMEIHSTRGFGLCGLNGEIILEPEFEAITDPCEEFFPISKGNRLERTTLLFILNSKTGERFDAPADAWIHNPGKGNPIRFKTMRGGRTFCGYMTPFGRVVISPSFSDAEEFSDDGLALVSRTGGCREFINKNGLSVSPKYEQATQFFENLAIVGIKEKDIVLYGLINEKFELILQPKFHQMQRLSKNLYAAQKVADGPWEAINSSGESLFSFPAGITHIFPQQNAITCITRNLPTAKAKYIFLDYTGNVLSSNENSRPVNFEFGLAARQVGSEWELIDKEERVTKIPNASYLKILSSERILKYAQDNRFNAAIWRNPNPVGFGPCMNRIEHFNALLKEFNLIGMPRTQLEQLLGPTENPRNGASFYWISTGVCGHSWTGIEIEFDHEKVSRWRESRKSGENLYSTSWVTTNMLLNPNPKVIERAESDPVLPLIPKPTSL